MKYTRKIDSIVEVEQVDELFDEGTTYPVKCQLASGIAAAVKYMKNRCGERVLINEYIGACISDLLGLTMPKYGICNLSAEIIDSTNENEEIDYRNAGLAFYTEYHSKAIPINPSNLLSLVSNHETEKIILFDHLVNNYDRHNGNLFVDAAKSPTLLYLIDNSHIITTNIYQTLDQGLNEATIITNQIINDNDDIYRDLCHYVGYNEEKFRVACTEAKDILTKDVLTSIESEIPLCWKESYGCENVEKMFKIIYSRIIMIDDIERMIIEEGRIRKWEKY